MRVQVDRDICCGSGMCAAVAPDYFELDAQGTLVVLREQVEVADAELVSEALNCCPVQALSLA
jgi:ferredoxin